MTIGPLYGDGARSLQDTHDSRSLADLLERMTVHAELTDDDIELITAQNSVWISTVDAAGWPDVSYKGGDVGFVRATSPTELRIPSYDGNGMMRTLGNIVDTGRVALLFVDTARPWRMRVHGHARVSVADGDLAGFHGSQAVMIVSIARIFPNCGRYIHQDGISEYVPRPGHEPPVPAWKQLDGINEALPAHDPARRGDPG